MRKAMIYFLATVVFLGLCACGGPKEVENMSYTANICGEDYSGLYTGTVIEKIPNGEGTFVCNTDTGHINYSGSWEAGKLVGSGCLEMDSYVITYTDGKIREGEFKGETIDGIPSGIGMFTTENDAGEVYSYTGEWENGQFNGEGTVKFDNDAYFTQAGNYVNGDYLPTPLQYFTALGTRGNHKYDITEDAAAFIDDNSDIFLNNSIENNELEVDQYFKYEAFAKNPEKNGGKLIKLNWLTVVQIFEYSEWGYDRTFCIARDSSHRIYYINMIGVTDDIYEGSGITVIALPLDYFTYPNTLGEKIWAVACAAVSIE